MLALPVAVVVVAVPLALRPVAAAVALLAHPAQHLLLPALLLVLARLPQEVELPQLPVKVRLPQEAQLLARLVVEAALPVQLLLSRQSFSAVTARTTR
jgi:hypothetical protein